MSLPWTLFKSTRIFSTTLSLTSPPLLQNQQGEVEGQQIESLEKHSGKITCPWANRTQIHNKLPMEYFAPTSQITKRRIQAYTRKKTGTTPRCHNPNLQELLQHHWSHNPVLHWCFHGKQACPIAHSPGQQAVRHRADEQYTAQ